MALILDCSILLPGPLTGKILAQMGHEVLKVENPSRPDPARKMGGGATYRDLNSLKKLTALNLEDPVDSEQFKALIQRASGLIEGYKPETKKKLGLTAETLHSINPDLVVISITGYPVGHPKRAHGGHDLNFQALTGAASLSPHLPPIPLGDILCAYRAALGFTTHMLKRAQDPKLGGALIESSIFDAIADCQTKSVSEYRETKELPTFGTTLVTGKYPCYGYYPTSDQRQIAVGAIEERYWILMCQTLGLNHLAQNPEIRLYSEEQALPIKAELAAAFSAHPLSHWQKVFAPLDACVTPVLNYKEIYGA